MGRVLFAAALLGVFVSASARADGDPCALRARSLEHSSVLLRDADEAHGRARACLAVVASVALEREGKRAEAAAFLRSAAASLPLIAMDLEARALRVVAPVAADPGPPTDADEAAARVTWLIARARPKEAVALATSFPRGAVQHDALEVATVTALVRADRVDDAIAHAGRMLQSEPLQKARAWAFSKARRYREAREGYAALAAQTQDRALKADVTFYAAFSAYEGNELALARAMFEAAADVVKDTQFEGFSRWYLALCHILDGQHADAARVLRSLVSDLPQDKEVRKHRYWLARSLWAAGDERAGRQALEAIMRDDPTDWYGLLARARLGKKPLKGKKVAGDALVRRARRDDGTARARLLHGLALDEEVRAVVRVATPTVEDVGLAQALDDWFFGYRRGPSFLPYPRARGDALVGGAGWRASYATPWRDAADAAGARTGVKPSFLYAIVRTESGFDPRAVSVAGALGATQLLPAVAREAARQLDEPPELAERIFEPAVSLLLGSTILALHERELGCTLLAAAAYNGAPQNVAAWMTEHGHLEVELFVERIPFRETRDYVKKVLPTEALYRGLDGHDVALALPARIGPPPASLTLTAPDR